MRKVEVKISTQETKMAKTCLKLLFFYKTVLKELFTIQTQKMSKSERKYIESQ